MASFDELEHLKSKRRSMLALTTVSFDDLPPNSSVQTPGTDLASNSQVEDLGNGKHLEQQADSENSSKDATAPSQVSADLLVFKPGTGFRAECETQPMSEDRVTLETRSGSLEYEEGMLEQAVPGPQNTTTIECGGSLGDELREAYCETESKQRREFLPIDALDKIVTDCRVREEVSKFSKGSQDELDQYVRHVLGASIIAGQATSRKKIFAILALIDKLEAISDFISEDLYDFHLPFEKDKAQSPAGLRKGRPELSRKPESGGLTRTPIRLFDGWTGAQTTSFERVQWDVLVPIFFLNDKQDPKVRHYPLEESVILPFVEDDEVKQGGKMGGFADVWRVKFHPSHHNQGGLAPVKGENPSFAIKRLRCMDRKAFSREVQNLKRFSTRDYLHLIKLLGTYEWRHQYYLVFPWADGNLLDFWKGHTEPLAPKRDINTALWFSEQCMGLVKGMKMIHTWDMPDVCGQHDVFSFDTSQTHGLHGDLKPENILWFKQYGDSSSLGHFKISDFGLSHFHGTKSAVDIDAKEIGFSPTYRAPERDVKGKVAQSYDMWSLACVLLEFASWYLGGYDEVKSFGQRRVNEDVQFDDGFRQDRFFNFMEASQVMPDNRICVVEKASVVQEFDRLYEDSWCSDYLLDFLELVKKDLLRLGPEKRKSCIGIAESLQKLHDNLKKDPSYGVNKIKQPPSRSRTLDSILMEGEVSPDLKRQIHKQLPRRTSFDRVTSRNSMSIPAVLSSSSSPGQHSPVLSSAGDYRPSSPERKATFRLSRDLTTVQEFPAFHGNEALVVKEQDTFPVEDGRASATTAVEHKCHVPSMENSTGLAITRSENKMGAEVASPNHGPDACFNEHDASSKSSPPEPEPAPDPEQTIRGASYDAPQLAHAATRSLKLDEMGQWRCPIGDTDGENRRTSNSGPRIIDPVELLRVPPNTGVGRPSSDSTTVSQTTSDAGKPHGNSGQARASSQIGNQGREMMNIRTCPGAESVENGQTENGWFMSFLQKIPCFK